MSAMSVVRSVMCEWGEVIFWGKKLLLGAHNIFFRRRIIFLSIGSFMNAFEDIRLLPNKISLNIKINNYY